MLKQVYFSAYTSFFMLGLLLSMQIPFVGFQPIKTSEHLAAAGKFFPGTLRLKVFFFYFISTILIVFKLNIWF